MSISKSDRKLILSTYENAILQPTVLRNISTSSQDCSKQFQSFADFLNTFNSDKRFFNQIVIHGQFHEGHCLLYTLMASGGIQHQYEILS